MFHLPIVERGGTLVEECVLRFGQARKHGRAGYIIVYAADPIEFKFELPAKLAVDHLCSFRPVNESLTHSRGRQLRAYAAIANFKLAVSSSAKGVPFFIRSFMRILKTYLPTKASPFRQMLSLFQPSPLSDMLKGNGMGLIENRSR